MEKAEIITMIIGIQSEVERIVSSDTFKKDMIKKGIKGQLQENLNQKKISNTDYNKALDILNTYSF